MEEKVQVEHRLHYCLTFLGNIHQLLSLRASLSNWVPANFQGNFMNHNYHHFSHTYPRGISTQTVYSTLPHPYPSPYFRTSTAPFRQISFSLQPSVVIKIKDGVNNFVNTLLSTRSPKLRLLCKLDKRLSD